MGEGDESSDGHRVVRLQQLVVSLVEEQEEQDEEPDGQSHLVVAGEGQHDLVLQVSLVDPGQKQFQIKARGRV